MSDTLHPGTTKTLLIVYHSMTGGIRQMAEAAADVHRASAVERELAPCVAPVSNRKERRRKERRLALAPVRMSGEDPALIYFPNGQIDGIGIVTQHDRRAP